jgi:hypothetical protein
MTDFLVYFGSLYPCEVLTTYAHILYALYWLDITLKIRNFIMSLFVYLYEIVHMQFIGMCLRTVSNEISHTKPQRFISHLHHTED